MNTRRFSVTSVLDVGELEPYYNRMDVFVSFTDDGLYDYTGAIDQNRRPEGIFAYPINNVVGRQSRETTLYGRVFRYKTVDNDTLEVVNYRIDDFERDARRLHDLYPDLSDEIDEHVMLAPGRLKSDSPFGRLWITSFYVALEFASGMSDIQFHWTRVLMDLGYTSFYDRRGMGIITSGNDPVLLVISDVSGDVEDLEIVSTQEHQKEQNAFVRDWVQRFNDRVEVSNARNRIKKW